MLSNKLPTMTTYMTPVPEGGSGAAGSTMMQHSPLTAPSAVRQRWPQRWCRVAEDHWQADSVVELANSCERTDKRYRPAPAP